MRKIVLAAFLTVLVFTRFWNLGETARFTRDESADLAKTYDLSVNKKFKFIGPIDSTNTIVYSSLTLYMFLPFAVVGEFHPASTALSTAFFSVVAVLLLVSFLGKIKSKELTLAIPLLIVWHPLVQSARWGWNPHLVPFWTAFAVLIALKRTNRRLFTAGLALGFAFHIHYLTIASSVVFMGIICIQALRQRRFSQIVALGLGFVIPISTFVLFDMTHPPGLFFGHYLGNNIVSNGLAQRLANFIPMFITNCYASFYYLTQSSVLAVLTIVCFVLLALRDIASKRALLYLLPVFAQILALSFVPTYQDRYFLLSIVYLFVWLIYPRVKVVDRVLVKVMLLVMVIGGLLALRTNLTVPIAQPSGNVVAQVAAYMKREITEQELKNVNVAVLVSPDREPLALIYRDMAHINGFTLLDKSEYWKTDTLFVVSTSDESSIRADQANVMEGFRSGPLKSEFRVPDSNWLIYRFTRR